ncbi:alpha/beta fold hydrolase [Mesoplasma lactucae]|uniref:Uncharacterized protein n=1 Tax=Mesoplasma lactucae ATCC 49193 TaxID=81460 RepID=A0A291ISD1_9MOLU|nr:alpha/beta hydrolase [Mesoplasma lactucae]ATG97792.1 hypothetical protein CP520_03585 [Mesoplasma lactucae ATCC 49193]ATZ20430.1 alpha/beta hydrolase [Mesoplasma lactucae ATCC 49193]MCL8216602.1 2-succinyl-6-hydroxy-2,4-cyclohexadiene-1-carboxylate synthase [Mesoplasma lactucae ATCC 49193]
MEYQVKPNQTIYYEEYGEGKPLFILHGLCVDHHYMVDEFEQVLKNSCYRRIYLDLPGMGKSSSFIRPTSDEILNQVLQMIDDLSNHEEFYLAGHSYGAYLGLAIAYQRERLCKGLFANSPAVYADEKKRYLSRHHTIGGDISTINFNNNTKAFNEYFSTNVLIDQETWDKYEKEVLIGTNNCNFDFIHDLQHDGFKDYELSCERDLRMKKVSTPLLLVSGKEDNVVGWKDQMSLMDNWLNGSMILLSKAGHNLQMDQPEVYQDMIKDFFLNKLN